MLINIWLLLCYSLCVKGLEKVSALMSARIGFISIIILFVARSATNVNLNI